MTETEMLTPGELGKWQKDDQSIGKLFVLFPEISVGILALFVDRLKVKAINCAREI